MFILKDDFKNYDDNKQPYSFSVERHTEIENLHAGVTDEGFSLKSIGNRFILNTPMFNTGVFNMKFRMTFLAEYNPKFYVIFQYDEQRRTGKGICFEYNLTGSFDVSLVDVDKMSFTVIESKKTENMFITENDISTISVRMEENRIVCVINTVEVEFKCGLKKGKLALERKNFIGELILKEIEFTSDDVFEFENVLKKRTVKIPMINGGDIPYEFTWEVNRADNDYYLLCSLDGGTKTRKVNREDRPGQYVAEKDFMDFPYVGICSNNADKKYYMFSGTAGFIDPNIFWDCQKRLFGDVDIPLSRCFKLDDFTPNEDTEIFFGYKELRCSNYNTQKGAGEFRYDTDGNMTYAGEPLDGRDIYEVFSPFDKKVMSYIPDRCFNREEMVEHLKYNHYFDVSENIKFNFKVMTQTPSDYLTAKVRIVNVYETEVIAEREVRLSFEPWKNGYCVGVCDAEFTKLDVGVYKIELLMYYGTGLYHRETKAFEVFNEKTDEIPALKSGLPFVFSMPNEHKWLMRNSFDLWNPARSCNVEHYISCVTDTPIEAEKRKTWEVIRPFKRQWFAWLADRTCRDWSMESHPEVVKNADYLYYSIDSEMYPIRNDLWKINNYKRKEFMEIFHSFLRENPEIAEKLDYKEGMEDFGFSDLEDHNIVSSGINLGETGFTYKHLKNLMDICQEEWTDYAVNKFLEMIRKQNETLKKINPKVKRSIYGPFNAYVNAANSYHSIKAYGLPCDERLSKDVYTGFAIFEDYPYSCSYQTYRGAFAAMTIKLHIPELKLYPEQYKGGIGGCVDGAVKFANAPMGANEVMPYQNSTHAFEYVFNTAYKLADGYHYWEDYGFHRPDFTDEMMERLVRDWKYVIENKPKKPIKSLAFIAEYSDCENVYDDSVMDAEGFGKLNNLSDNAHGFIYECSREAGVPNGFALKFDTLKTLKAEECDLLVLPTLSGADEEYLQEIRRLYNEGVNLLAVSDITGLEDIFEVEKCKRIENINIIDYNGESEYIYERTAEFKYKALGAKTVVTVNNDIPAMLCTNRTALINTSVIDLGSECFEGNPGKSKRIIGKLVKKAVKDIVKRLSNPLVYSDTTGLTLFETESGKTMLLAIDYTPFDNNKKKTKQGIVRINTDDITDVKSDEKLLVGRKDGFVKEIRFDIKPHGFVFVELLK